MHGILYQKCKQNHQQGEEKDQKVIFEIFKIDAECVRKLLDIVFEIFENLHSIRFRLQNLLCFVLQTDKQALLKRPRDPKEQMKNCLSFKILHLAARLAMPLAAANLLAINCFLVSSRFALM